jgi:hypothetical protein
MEGEGEGEEGIEEEMELGSMATRGHSGRVGG